MESFELFDSMEGLIKNRYETDRKLVSQRKKALTHLNKIERQIERLQKNIALTKHSFLTSNKIVNDMVVLMDKKMVAKLDYDLLDAYVNGRKSDVYLMFTRKRKYVKDRELKNK